MSDLNRLYNSKVVESSKADRPIMDNWLGRGLQKVGVEHQGVVVKNDAGQQYLVHKVLNSNCCFFNNKSILFVLQSTVNDSIVIV